MDLKKKYFLQKKKKKKKSNFNYAELFKIAKHTACN